MNISSRAAKIGGVITVILVIALAVIAAGVYGPKAAHPIQGDQLGPERNENPSAYQHRADTSLKSMPTDAPAYAMVTFAQPLTDIDAAEVLEAAHTRRVNTVIPLGSHPIAIPEPAATDAGQRRPVLTRGLKQARREFGRPVPGWEGPKDSIAAVTVWSDQETLKALRDDDRVAAVEVAPPDAVWGNIALRPPLTS